MFDNVDQVHGCFLQYDINALVDALLFENVFIDIYVHKLSNKERPKLWDQFFCVTIHSVFLDIGTMVVDYLLDMLIYPWVACWWNLCIQYDMA